MGPWDCKQYSTATPLDLDMESGLKGWMSAGHQFLRWETAAQLGYYYAEQARCYLRNLLDSKQVQDHVFFL
jgi:hypothetical protein